MTIQGKRLTIEDVEFTFSRITRNYVSAAIPCNNGDTLYIISSVDRDGNLGFRYVVMEEDSQPFVSAPFADDSALMLAVNGRINRDPSRDQDNEKTSG